MRKIHSCIALMSATVATFCRAMKEIPSTGTGQPLNDFSDLFANYMNSETYNYDWMNPQGPSDTPLYSNNYAPTLPMTQEHGTNTMHPTESHSSHSGSIPGAASAFPQTHEHHHGWPSSQVEETRESLVHPFPSVQSTDAFLGKDGLDANSYDTSTCDFSKLNEFSNLFSKIMNSEAYHVLMQNDWVSPHNKEPTGLDGQNYGHPASLFLSSSGSSNNNVDDAGSNIRTHNPIEPYSHDFSIDPAVSFTQHQHAVSLTPPTEIPGESVSHPSTSVEATPALLSHQRPAVSSSRTRKGKEKMPPMSSNKINKARTTEFKQTASTRGPQRHLISLSSPIEQQLNYFIRETGPAVNSYPSTNLFENWDKVGQEKRLDLGGIDGIKNPGASDGLESSSNLMERIDSHLPEEINNTHDVILQASETSKGSDTYYVKIDLRSILSKLEMSKQESCHDYFRINPSSNLQLPLKFSENRLLAGAFYFNDKNSINLKSLMIESPGQPSLTTKASIQFARRHFMTTNWKFFLVNKENWNIYFSTIGIPNFEYYLHLASRLENDYFGKLFSFFLFYVEMIDQLVLPNRGEGPMRSHTSELDDACRCFWYLVNHIENGEKGSRSSLIGKKVNAIKTRMDARRSGWAHESSAVWNFLEFWLGNCRSSLLKEVNYEKDLTTVTPQVKSLFNNLFSILIQSLTHEMASALHLTIHDF